MQNAIYGWHCATYKMAKTIFHRDDTMPSPLTPSILGWKAKWIVALEAKITVGMESKSRNAKWRVNPATVRLGYVETKNFRVPSFSLGAAVLDSEFRADPESGLRIEQSPAGHIESSISVY